MKFRQQNLVSCLAIVLQLVAAEAAAQTADLELVLAVDASGSVDEAEFSLQLAGIAQGFRDPAVLEAIRRGPEGRIAVNLIAWAEHGMPKADTGWHQISDESSANQFATKVENFLRNQNGATGLGEGIAASVRSINENGVEAPRRVIDVSGDGRETPAREYVVLLPQARAMSIAYGIIVNGLAISNADEDLAEYYRSELQTGPGSFVMEAGDYGDFAEAMRRKLLREIEYRPDVTDAGAGLPPG